MKAHAFDAAAPFYDATFTRTRLGRWLRAAVWERLDGLFSTGDRVLELGCGTGEDAIWLARRGMRVYATDAAPAMLATARVKAEAAGVANVIELATLDLAQPERSAVYNAAPGSFDGVLSNFGGLNCVADRRPVAELLGRLTPGGSAS